MSDNLKMAKDSSILTMAYWWVVYDLTNDTIFTDIEYGTKIQHTNQSDGAFQNVSSRSGLIFGPSCIARTFGN